jgi:beta-lactamase superfamily II metal-dependent hydrolase
MIVTAGAAIMIQYLDDDVVDLRKENGSTWQYYWGDACEVLSESGSRRHVRMHGLKGVVDEGFIAKAAKLRSAPILRMSMVDVQQGDGLILDTPSGKVIFIDAGENKLFCRHAAARYQGTSAADPLVVDAAIITHGDADHFAGLNEFSKSEVDTQRRKRIFMTARRVYHNGLVKRPGKKAGRARPELEMFGETTLKAGHPYCTELEDDPRDVVDADLNQFFKPWKKTLKRWAERLHDLTGETMEVRRLDQTATDAFDFLAADGISVEVMGPITEVVDGQPGLAFLRTPPKDANLMLGIEPGQEGEDWSASHTINGHSIMFRLRYGHVRFLFTGDLNEESMARLRKVLPQASLKAEILKTPHHGSADFNLQFLKQASPVVSLISSGDESEAKEHIHPRATLVAALGQASRSSPAVIFCTELAAFFAYRGKARVNGGKPFDAFERLNFGIAHVRTDGERVLAFTHSGEKGMNEAYRFTVSRNGAVKFAAEAVKRSAPKLQ